MTPPVAGQVYQQPVSVAWPSPVGPLPACLRRALSARWWRWPGRNGSRHRRLPRRSSHRTPGVGTQDRSAGRPACRPCPGRARSFFPRTIYRRTHRPRWGPGQAGHRSAGSLVLAPSPFTHPPPSTRIGLQPSQFPCHRPLTTGTIAPFPASRWPSASHGLWRCCRPTSPGVLQ